MCQNFVYSENYHVNLSENIRNMKHIYTLLLVWMSCLLLSSCQTVPEERLISVTIEPQRYFVEKIAGERFHVHCVTPVGQSPETYDPAPQQMMQIGNSMAYFKIGYIGFELAWMKTIEEQNPDMKVYDLSKGMNLIENNEEEEHEGHAHRHGMIDPHIWTSVAGAKVIIQNISDALMELDPENRALYAQNYEQALAEIEAVKEEIERILQPVKGTSFIIYHPALTYFAREFGLNQLCIELDGKEPSPAQLKNLIEVAHHSRTKIIFNQQEFDKKNAELIAKETGCKLVQINPLSYNWKDEMINLAKVLAGDNE